MKTCRKDRMNGVEKYKIDFRSSVDNSIFRSRINLSSLSLAWQGFHGVLIFRDQSGSIGLQQYLLKK